MIPKFRAYYKGEIYEVTSLDLIGSSIEIDLADVSLGPLGRYIKVKLGNGRYEAIPMMSTGLKDKNGVESYRDDIVKTADGRIWQIKHGTFFWHVPKDVIELYGFYLQPIPNLDNHPIRIYENFGEIIGTIHTHPELLAGDDLGE